MMWTRTHERIVEAGSQVIFDAPLERVYWEPGAVQAVEAGGVRHHGSHFLSSVAIRDLVEALTPAPPQEVLAAARQLKYRDFLTVALVVRAPDLFPDNWIYVHDPDVRMGRIQNFKNWSPEMVPDPETSCLGLEYFCFEGDDLWSSPDDALIELGKREIGKLGLADPSLVTDGAIVRMQKAYPVYDGVYPQALAVIRDFLDQLPNLQLIGRNGMHRYNNQDHSMLTAMLAARNIAGSTYDLWRVNVEQEYHEEGSEVTAMDLKKLEHTQPLVPRRLG
jgi:protoporphyrinogen oxidase